MISFGFNKQIVEIMFGSTPVTTVMLGNVEIWPRASVNYKQLSYEWDDEQMKLTIQEEDKETDENYYVWSADTKTLDVHEIPQEEVEGSNS